jgi:Zn-dependent protease
MFGSRLRLFRLLGFEVRLDASWIIIALLIVWSLGAGTFPAQYPALPSWAHWTMAGAGAIGLFLSIVFHELSHSLVARTQGISMRGITLFIFGGVAEMENEPPTARAEFLMAIAGPIASFVLAGVFFALATISTAAGWPIAAGGTFLFLSGINLTLAIFNLIPAFPLDGGRVLRSALWAWKGNLRWATRISSSLGSAFGIVLMLLGAFFFFRGDPIGGIWFALIGLFVRSAAMGSYRQLILREALDGERVRRFMTPPAVVSPDTPVDALVEEHLYRRREDLLPVVDDGGALLGCVSLDRVKRLPREEWPLRRAREVVSDCGVDDVIGPDESAVAGLRRLRGAGRSRLLVVEDGRPVGVLSLSDLLGFISMKLELEGNS